jgi:hypothetical protein
VCVCVWTLDRHGLERSDALDTVATYSDESAMTINIFLTD